MPIVPLKLIPGVNSEFTQTLNEAGISSCNMIRFKAKLPEKLGGWTRYFPLAMLGTPRDLHAWQDLNGTGWLAVGTTQQLAVIADGTLKDITPQTLVSDFAPNFTTTASSTTIEINDPNISNVTIFDSVFFNTPVSVGGIVLSGLYPIDSITGATTYTITADDAATSSTTGGDVPVFSTTSGTSQVIVSFPDHGLAVNDIVVFPLSTSVGGITIDGAYNVIQIGSVNQFSISGAAIATTTTSADMNGGDAQLLYYIALGPSATGVGYGVGGYGLGGFGTGVVPSAQIGSPITATNWSSDNWGQILLACPEGGGIYYWDPTGGFQNASLVSSGPPFNGGLFVAMPEQILVAWGSSITQDIGVQRDPLLVRWSDSQNFLEWSVTSSTQAGSQRIPTGTKIVGAMQGPQQGLFWTDIDLYASKYIGPPLVYGFTQVSSGCGLVGPHAKTSMRGNVYWMSPGNFFVLGGGGIQDIPCSVWDVIFQDLDTDNQSKCVAAANSAFDEVAFYYPSLSGGTGEIDSYVKFNTEERVWDYGTLSRVAWIDQSVLGEPIGASSQGLIYQHETSTNADGQPLSWFYQTGYFVLSEGQELAFVDWFFPDMKFGLFGGSQTATVLVTIYVAEYPNSAPEVYGPYTMTSAVNYVNTRLRGRQISLKFEGNDLNSFSRLGNMRLRVAKDGRR